MLLTVMLLEAHHSSMGAATTAAGKIVFFIPALLAGILNLAFSIVLARHYGLIGVTLGTLIAQVTTNNWYAPWYTLRLFNIRFSDHLRGVVFPVLGLAMVVLCVGGPIRIATRALPAAVSLAIGVTAMAAAGSVYFFTILVKPLERKQILRKLRAAIGALLSTTSG